MHNLLEDPQDSGHMCSPRCSSPMAADFGISSFNAKQSASAHVVLNKRR